MSSTGRYDHAEPFDGEQHDGEQAATPPTTPALDEGQVAQDWLEGEAHVMAAESSNPRSAEELHAAAQRDAESVRSERDAGIAHGAEDVPESMVAEGASLDEPAEYEAPDGEPHLEHDAPDGEREERDEQPGAVDPDGAR
ncbi:hypothetical protein FH969_10020 [Miniimonas arenae]|uniref:DUF5709 domain-containing protein n=1 Tax=Miniimonas arenae TaxID=676201 RepID=A0A5C5BCK9_9MICO|nr:hypothetical protein [Miniimonas arenae]TNU73725.1 hypothetical protein FH969_10020 [Miniimonas arenae]